MLHREGKTQLDFEIWNFVPTLVPRGNHQLSFPAHMDFSVSHLQGSFNSFEKKITKSLKYYDNAPSYILRSSQLVAL